MQRELFKARKFLFFSVYLYGYIRRVSQIATTARYLPGNTVDNLKTRVAYNLEARTTKHFGT